MARAKQTDRAEARKRHRQAQAAQGAGDEGADELDFGERRTDLGDAPSRARTEDRRPASGRLGFGAAFRAAYHPANVRDDLRALPQTVRSRAFLIGLAMVIGGGIAVYLYPAYTGSQFAWELLVLPGSALAPQLVAGFFAPRASYLLGFLVGLAQAAAYVTVVTSERVRAAIEAIQPGAAPVLAADAILIATVSACFTGALFAAAAAWYRRFLALSSPRRQPPGRSSSRGQSGGSSSRSASRRTASR